jgi:hypothetical protein
MIQHTTRDVQSRADGSSTRSGFCRANLRIIAMNAAHPPLHTPGVVRLEQRRSKSQRYRNVEAEATEGEISEIQGLGTPGGAVASRPEFELGVRRKLSVQLGPKPETPSALLPGAFAEESVGRTEPGLGTPQGHRFAELDITREVRNFGREARHYWRRP